MAPNFTFPKNIFLKPLLSTLLLLIISNVSVIAQIQIDPKQQKEADSLKKAHATVTTTYNYYTPKKNFGNAALDFGLAELTPWVFDRYVTKKDYARISWKTVGHNLNPGSWEFDNDPFQTNQFGHPYHGSNFYSAFRANGYTFWQSAPA